MIILYLSLFLGSLLTPQELDMVVEGVKHSDSLLQSCRVSVYRKEIYPSGSEKYWPANWKEFGKPYETYGQYLFNGKMQMVKKTTPETPKLPKMNEHVVYDGERILQLIAYYPKAPFTPSREAHLFPASHFKFVFYPDFDLRFWMSFDGKSLSELLKDVSVTVKPLGIENINGDNCFRLQVIDSSSIVEYVINLAKGYRIQEIRNDFGPGQKIFHSNIYLSQYKDQIWYPGRVHNKVYNIDESSGQKVLMLDRYYEYTNFEGNIEIPKEVFSTIPPPDAEVYRHE